MLLASARGGLTALVGSRLLPLAADNVARLPVRAVHVDAETGAVATLLGDRSWLYVFDLTRPLAAEPLVLGPGASPLLCREARVLCHGASVASLSGLVLHAQIFAPSLQPLLQGPRARDRFSSAAAWLSSGFVAARGDNGTVRVFATFAQRQEPPVLVPPTRPACDRKGQPLRVSQAVELCGARESVSQLVSDARGTGPVFWEFGIGVVRSARCWDPHAPHRVGLAKVEFPRPTSGRSSSTRTSVARVVPRRGRR